MTFLCEYNVNTASPWKSKLNKETNKKESSQQKIVPLEKLLPKKKHNKDIYESFEKDTIESKSDVIMENEIQTKIEGEDNAIEVIASKDSSIIIIKKD